MAGTPRDPASARDIGDQRRRYEGEMKRFRAEGDFLLRALTDLISQCRSQIHQLGKDFEELEKLAGEWICGEMSFKRYSTWAAGNGL